MTEQPLVSVIINCYNGEEFLRETIDSVINQTYSNWELIFWDNQSTDSTAEIIKSYQDDRIRYFYAPNHTPLGEARNLAMKQVGGKYLAFLDSDDIWYPDFLKIGVEYLERDSSCVGFYCNFHYHDGHKRIVKKSQIKTVCYHDFIYLLKNYSIGMSGSLISFEIVHSNNIYFKKKYNLIEDFDFFLSLSIFGSWIYYPDIMMFYRVHPNSTSYKYRNEWALEYNVMINDLKERYVEKGDLDESDLSVLYEKYLEAKFEAICYSGKRKEVLLFLYKHKELSIRLMLKCMLFFVIGKKIVVLKKYLGS